MVTNSMSISGGAEALVLNIFNGLKDRPNIKVKLVTLKTAARTTGYDIEGIEGPLSRDPDFLDSESYVRLSLLKPDKVDVSQFTDLVNSFKPHVIHSHLFLSEMIAHEVLFPGVKYFSHCHDNMPQFRNFSFKTFTEKKLITDFFEKRRLVKRYLKCNNKFISISADTRSYFQNVLPAKLSKNIISLDNAIVTKNYRGLNPAPDLGTIRIINVGRFTTLKNQQLLVDITKELVQRGHQVKVVMLGKGSEYESVKAKVVANKLEGVISMPGTQANMADYYAAANVYLPVVSLDGKGNRGLIDQGENGYMLAEPNPAEFADTIEKVLGNRDTYQAMAVKSVAFAKKYDIEEYLPKLIGIYRMS